MIPSERGGLILCEIRRIKYCVPRSQQIPSPQIPVEAPVGNKNLVVEVCLPNQLVAIVPPEHPEAQRENLTYEDLVKYPFICREEGSGTREMINEFLTQGSQGGPDDLKMAMELGSPEETNRVREQLFLI